MEFSFSFHLFYILAQTKDVNRKKGEIMSHKKSKNKQRQNQYKGYNQNQQASYSGEDGLMSEKYKENSNAQE